jgi:hypothetical protein
VLPMKDQTPVLLQESRLGFSWLGAVWKSLATFQLVQGTAVSVCVAVAVLVVVIVGVDVAVLG